ncbi:MAG: hypothetical protein JST58_04335 [Bacteroidetes bacterium]|nr:hypothetical protein [Bacteroidota bacterium]
MHYDTATQVLDTALIDLKSASSLALENVLGQFWKMEDADQKHWNQLLWDSISDKKKFPELALYRDFSLTENARDHIRFGKWAVNKKNRKLLLKFTDGTTEIYTIQKIAYQNLVVSKKDADGNEMTLYFSSDGLVHKRPEEDPFYPSNNRWRIKPSRSETDQQILDRLKQCAHFYALFFSDNHQRQETDISFIGLPNCFVWYNGGIGLPLEGGLDNKWIDCFYSKKEALKAYQMLKTLIEKHVLVWPEHPTSWIKETADMLDQVHDKIKLE